MTNKKIGIFSGSFDPIHSGHISFALEALRRLGLDRVFFLPEPRPRRKQAVKALEHRVRMVQLALDNQPRLGVIVLEQARFTPHQTLPVLQARFKGSKLYMLIGEDMLDHLADWPHIDELVADVHFVIGTRKRTQAELKQHVNSLCKTRGLNFDYTVFRAKDAVVSSSVVRTKLHHGQLPNGIDGKVLRYIHKNNLYGYKK